MFQISKHIEFNMIEEVVTLGSIGITQRIHRHLWPSKHMVSQPKLHHKNARGPNRIAPHHILWDRGKRKIVRNVVGFIKRRIALILLKSLPQTPTPFSLVLIIRFMVMM
jgi:hypothetical protein